MMFDWVGVRIGEWVRVSVRVGIVDWVGVCIRGSPLFLVTVIQRYVGVSRTGF